MNDDDRVYADGFHVGKVLIPFFLSPVLMRDIMGNFIQKGTCNTYAVVLWNDQMRLQTCGRFRMKARLLVFRQYLFCIQQRGCNNSRGACQQSFFYEISSIDHNV